MLRSHVNCSAEMHPRSLRRDRGEGMVQRFEMEPRPLVGALCLRIVPSVRAFEARTATLDCGWRSGRPDFRQEYAATSRSASDCSAWNRARTRRTDKPKQTFLAENSVRGMRGRNGGSPFPF